MPFRRLSKKIRDVLFFGASGSRTPQRAEPSRKKPRSAPRRIRSAPASKGSMPNLRRRYEEGTWLEQENLEPYRALRPCPSLRTASG